MKKTKDNNRRSLQRMVRPLVTRDGHALHWEHGYRCHGLWTADGRRCALVGIGPRRHWSPTDGWRWSLDNSRGVEGRAPSLASAKRAVERLMADATLSEAWNPSQCNVVVHGAKRPNDPSSATRPAKRHE